MMAQPAGRIYRRVGPRRMMIAGLTGVMFTTLAFLWVDLETSQWWIRGIMLARGWSFALTLIPIQTATFATIAPEDTGRASAVFNAGRQVAASFGVALLATVLTSRFSHYGAALGDPFTRDGALSAFHDAFIVAAALSVIGIAASFLIDDREASGTMHRRIELDAEGEPLGLPAD
jgi:MFS family permease